MKNTAEEFKLFNAQKRGIAKRFFGITEWDEEEFHSIIP